MDELILKRPFFERNEFVGSLSQGDRVADDLQIVIQFPLLHQGEIVGQVLGNLETFNRIAHVANANGPDLILRSKRDSDTWWEFYSEDVRIGSLQRRSLAPAYGDNLSSIVSQLKLGKFDIIRHFENRDAATRCITFFLAGPQFMWEIAPLIEKTSDGGVRTGTQNTRIDLDDSLPFSIEIKHRHFHDKSLPPDDYDLEAHVLALEFSTILTKTELTDDAFVEKATKVAEDIILLVSFMSRGWITWYMYELSTPEYSKQHVRRARDTSSKRIDWNDTLIEHGSGREFIKSAYTNLQKLRAKDMNIFMSIAYFLSGLEAKYLNEQFATLFLALEWTKDLLIRQDSELQSIIPSDRFDKLSDSLKETIRQTIDSSDIRGRIYEKLRELNRPSLRFIIDTLLSKYEVSYTDLYHAEEEFSLIKTRDSLFHSSKEIDFNHLFLEFYRLQSLLERLLLALLGWRDFSRSPDPQMRGWLQEKSDASQN